MALSGRRPSHSGSFALSSGQVQLLDVTQEAASLQIQKASKTFVGEPQRGALLMQPVRHAQDLLQHALRVGSATYPSLQARQTAWLISQPQASSIRLESVLVISASLSRSAHHRCRVVHALEAENRRAWDAQASCENEWLAFMAASRMCRGGGILTSMLSCPLYTKSMRRLPTCTGSGACV